MRILSIDPGYERLGIAILDKEKPEKDCLAYSECFRTPKEDPHEERLSQIKNRLDEIIKEFSPEELAIEDLFFNTNQKTALLVAEARGLIIGTAKSSGLSVFEYKPQEIKVAVTGNGRSDKTSIIKMVAILVDIKKKIKFDDEYDAIACGLTHLAVKIGH